MKACHQPLGYGDGDGNGMAVAWLARGITGSGGGVVVVW